MWVITGIKRIQSKKSCADFVLTDAQDSSDIVKWWRRCCAGCCMLKAPSYSDRHHPVTTIVVVAKMGSPHRSSLTPLKRLKTTVIHLCGGNRHILNTTGPNSPPRLNSTAFMCWISQRYLTVGLMLIQCTIFEISTGTQIACIGVFQVFQV